MRSGTSKEKPTTEHYVDNKEFLMHMIEFKDATKEAESAGKPKPRIPDKIGEVFMQIAVHLSYKSNFINYGFREDMISDGIENCIQYIHNFDPDKSRNPFAYFTQIIYYAFLRRIQKEKKSLYVKYKSLENSQIMDDLMVNKSGDYSRVSSTGFAKLYDNMSEFIGTFEESLQKKKDAKLAAAAAGTTTKKKKSVSANNLLQYATNVKPEDV
jgi:DNA-directed RNA polymerase specialized sigma24 family protein